MSKLAGNHKILAVSSNKVNLFPLERDFNCTDVEFHIETLHTSKVDCLSVSPCETFLVIAVQKKIFLYGISNYTPSIISSAEIVKAASCIRFFNKAQVFVIGDRSGCVSFFLYDNNGLEREKISFGHNSMLTDVLVSVNDDFVITSDRDEKIRVSRYPNVYNIQSYCLGHMQFVSSLSFLPTDSSVLMSTSGDGTLRLWDFINGKEILSYEEPLQSEPAAFVKQIAVIDSGINLVALQKYKVNEILLISIAGTKSAGFEVAVRSKVTTVAAVIDMGLLRSTIIYLIDNNEPFRDLSCYYQNSKNLPEWFISKVSNKLSSMLLSRNSETFEMFFKKDFDNTLEYHKRKKARLAEKGK